MLASLSAYGLDLGECLPTDDPANETRHLANDTALGCERQECFSVFISAKEVMFSPVSVCMLSK